MNHRLFAIALLICALPAFAGSAVVLTKADFIAAEKIDRHGEIVLSLKLSTSGKAKFKKLNKEAVGEDIHAEIGGVRTDLKLRQPIEGSTLEAGPYAPEEAAKVIGAISQN